MKQDDFKTGPAKKWEERRQLLASRKPRVRVDRCRMERAAAGGYHVVIEGFGLQPAFSPPQIAVGGVPLEGATFATDGRRVTGILRESPEGRQVVVDLGYAIAEGTADVE